MMLFKKVIVIIALFVLATGCSNKNQLPGNVSTVSPTSAATSSPTLSPTASAAPVATPADSVIDYNNYAKITWVDKTDTENSSFCITDITDGKISGIFVPGIYAPFITAVPSQYSYDYGKFSGTISDGKADCQFSADPGIKGSLLLVFEPNNQIHATIMLSEKSQYNNPKEGTFEYIPYNINNIKDFKIIESQSFTVNLNSWGNVRFVSVVLENSNHEPTLFYLTDKDGNILYNFIESLPYLVDVEAVSFVDVNNDGLTDIIVLVKSQDGSEELTAAFFQQTTDGTFFADPDLNSAINTGDNNKDIKTIVEYLSDRLPEGEKPQPRHQ